MMVVDDGCNDQTVPMKKTRCSDDQLPPNPGEGNAYITGLFKELGLDSDELVNIDTNGIIVFTEIFYYVFPE